MDYTVEIEGFIFGTFREKGETIWLGERQARTFLMEGRVSPAKKKAAAKS